MPKTILTDRDIEDHARRGETILVLSEDTFLTDLAYEKARALGITLLQAGPDQPPAAPLRPYLSRTSAPGTSLAAQSGRNLLRFTPQTPEAALRAAIVETGRLAYQSGLMVSNDGNISVRLPDGNILITPSGVSKGRIQPGELLVIDPEGNLVRPAADPALRPTSEQPMHLEVYRQRPDVRAVIHTHLIFANALAISRGQIRMDVIPEAAMSFGSVPITGFSMPSSTQNAEAIRGLVGAHDVILIRNHGSLTLGRDLDEALIRLERLEHVAKTLTFAELLGGVNPLPAELLEAIAQTMKK
ncbi:MAG TPA: class II aldolase/adducin family protein [Anaerolineaceae bacterium]|nr:class II aldolase/adducin family protein [Anaerolineaceae bacterium]